MNRTGPRPPENWPGARAEHNAERSTALRATLATRKHPELTTLTPLAGCSRPDTLIPTEKQSQKSSLVSAFDSLRSSIIGAQRHVEKLTELGEWLISAPASAYKLPGQSCPGSCRAQIEQCHDGRAEARHRRLIRDVGADKSVGFAMPCACSLQSGISQSTRADGKPIRHPVRALAPLCCNHLGAVERSQVAV